ncbi:heterodisulfide reductase-related iron-sulfur binding cluster [Chloroflexota bacterium]
MDNHTIENKKVAFYTGCFTNYYYPEAGEATVKILKKNGIEVVVPDQVCCALPMIAKGNTKEAYRNIYYNAAILSNLVSRGYAIIATCSSCSLMIKRDYPLLLESAEAKLVSENLYNTTEYLLLLNERGLLNTEDLYPVRQSIYYHTPCHLRAQGMENPTVKLLNLIPGVTINHIGNECCGMGGAYGYEKNNFKLAKEIAGKLYSNMKDYPADRAVTDCSGCKLQMEAGSSIDVVHPMILVSESYQL